MVYLFFFFFLFCFVYFCFSFFPNTGAQRQTPPLRTQRCPPHRRHASGHPLVSCWALHPASAPQPNPAFPGVAGEGAWSPAGPGHPGTQQEGPPERLEAGPRGECIRGERGPRITGRSAFLRHLLAPSKPRSDLCSIVFVVLGRDRKLWKGRGGKSRSN